tara:strand:+ start:102 stop:704 length:603 start_codon:yes stop_codon:yes gene_type:complete
VKDPKIESVDTFSFNSKSKKEAKACIAKYPKGKQASAVMPLLDIAQRQHDGWLPRIAMDYVADFLEIPRIAVYEVASFYTMYNLSPVGQNHVQVCTNLPCWLRGSDRIVTAIEKNLGIKMGETSKNNLFTLTEVECLGACVNAPMIQINDDYYEDLDETSVDVLLTEITNGGAPMSGSQMGRRSCEPIKGLTTLVDSIKD